MKLLRKIVGKTKIDRIRSLQIRESCGILPIIEWVKRRKECDEHVTRMGQYTCRKNISWTSKKKMEQLNTWLNHAESPTSKKKKKKKVFTLDFGNIGYETNRI
jgi:hypothetical protein